MNFKTYPGINFIIDGCILTAICDQCIDPDDGPRVVERGLIDSDTPPPFCMRCGKAFEVEGEPAR